MSKLAADNRALAFGILKFVAGLAFFAMLWGVLNIFVPDLFGSLGVGADGQQLQTTQNWFDLAWQGLPFIVVAMLATRFISRAAFESRGGVR
jgi:hypothetical protein